MSCTLGEVKNRADFIIYWGGNPAECHPRHFTKYTLTQKGKFVPNGRKDRTMVLVDIRETPSAKAADIFLQVRPGKDFEMITILRALVKGQRGGPGSGRRNRADAGAAARPRRPDEEGEVRRALLRHGPVDDARQAHELAPRLLTLAAEMNAFTKFVAMPMRGHGNVTGADVVMRCTTGYPFGVNLSRGYPRFNPGEFSTVDLLVRGDSDAALVLGADPGRDDAAAGDRPPGAHSDDRARPEGDAHEPAGPRPHHDGGDRHQRPGHGLPDGRDPAAAAAGAEVAVSDGRRGGAADSRSGAEEAGVVSDRANVCDCRLA